MSAKEIRYFRTPSKLKNSDQSQEKIVVDKERVTIGDNIEDHQFSGLDFSSLVDDSELDLVLSTTSSQDKFQEKARNIEKADFSKINDIINLYKRYKSIKDLFDWQKEWLKLVNVMINNNSFVYSAPTSAGKSLISEIIMLKNIIEFPTKVVMVVFPNISLINEKEYYYKSLLKRISYLIPEEKNKDGKTKKKKKLELICLHSGRNWFYNPDRTNLILWTIERANNFLNYIVGTEGMSELSNRISCIIIDEFHMIGDLSRGYYVESIITKLKYIENQENCPPVQVIGMSATLSNLDKIWEWINAELFLTNFRPIELNEYIMVNHKIYRADDVGGDQDYSDIPLENFCSYLELLKNETMDKFKILPLILQTVTTEIPNKMSKITDQKKPNRTGSVLVFWQSKYLCESVCLNLWKIVFKHKININFQCDSNTIKFIKAKIQNKELRQMIELGFAYHHSGLDFHERKVIEKAFKEGII